MPSPHTTPAPALPSSGSHSPTPAATAPAPATPTPVSCPRTGSSYIPALPSTPSPATVIPCCTTPACSCPCPARKFPPAPGSAQEKALLKGIELADVHILERIRFRENRLYWLYVGSFAIIAGIIHIPSGTTITPEVYFAGMLSIQLLSLGIAWNYYANNIKITKLEILQENSYDELRINKPPKDKNNMGAYRFIYHLMEISAFCLPTAAAYLCLHHMKTLVPSTTGQPVIPAFVQYLSLSLLIAALIGNFILSFFLDYIFGKKQA